MHQTVRVSVRISVDKTFVPPEIREFVPDETGWLGSGVVVAKDEGRHETLVLTANHVCAEPPALKVTALGPVGLKLKSIGIMFWDGFKGTAEKLAWDSQHDVCILRVHALGGEVAVLAAELPPIGARVQNAGSPHGLMEAGMVPVGEGFYSGIMLESDDMAVPQDVLWVSVPAQPGSSGSGVFYRGRLFGVISMKAMEQGMLAVPLQWVSRIVDFGIREWRSAG